MDESTKQIQIGVDGSDAIQGINQIGQAVGGLADKVRVSADSGSKSLDGMATQANQAAQKVEGAANSMEQSIKKVGATDAGSAGLNSLKTGLQATADSVKNLGTGAQDAYAKAGGTAPAVAGLNRLQKAIYDALQATKQLDAARGTDAAKDAADRATGAYGKLVSVLGKLDATPGLGALKAQADQVKQALDAAARAEQAFGAAVGVDGAKAATGQLNKAYSDLVGVLNQVRQTSTSVMGGIKTEAEAAAKAIKDATATPVPGVQAVKASAPSAPAAPSAPPAAPSAPAPSATAPSVPNSPGFPPQPNNGNGNGDKLTAEAAAVMRLQRAYDDAAKAKANFDYAKGTDDAQATSDRLAKANAKLQAVLKDTPTAGDAGLTALKVKADALTASMNNLGGATKGALPQTDTTGPVVSGYGRVLKSLEAVKDATIAMQVANSQASSKGPAGLDAAKLAAEEARKSYVGFLATLREVNGEISKTEKAGFRKIGGSFAKEIGINRNSAESLADDVAKRGLTGVDSILNGLGRVQGAQNQVTKSLDNMGMSAKQTTAALRQVPAQFTDIVVSLAGGQNPLTVLLQQGGQLKDVFGGVGVAAQALGGYVKGLISPFTVAIAAAAGLGAAFIAAFNETKNFNDALILSGNFAGTTARELSGMAKEIDKVVGTQGKASDTLAQLAGTGQIAADNFVKIGIAAEAMERATGQAVDKTIQQFVELQKSPLEASLKLNQATNFLTANLFNQIKALEDVGDKTGAAKVAMDAYADAVTGRSQQILGEIGAWSRSFTALKDIIKETADLATNLFRDTDLTPLQNANIQFDIMEKTLLAIKGLLPGVALFGTGLLGAKKEQIFALQSGEEKAREEARDTFRASERGVGTGKGAAALEVLRKGNRTPEKVVKEERTKLEGELNALIKSNSATEEQRDKILANFDANKRKKEPKGKGEGKLDAAQLAFDIGAEKNLLAERVGAFSNANKALDGLRANGLLADQQYFDAKRALLQGETDAERENLNAQIKRFENDDTKDPAQKIRVAAQLAEARSKLNLLEANSAQTLVGLNDAQADSLRKVQASYLTAAQAQQAYIDGQKRVQARTLDGIGRGDEARGISASRAQIDDKYEDELKAERNFIERLKALNANGKLNADQQRDYDTRLKIIQDFHKQALTNEDTFQKDMKAKSQDWRNGASEAVANFQSDAENSARSTAQVYANAFQSIEDAMFKLATTGKLTFKDLLGGIINDLARIGYRDIINQGIKGIQGGALGDKAADLFAVKKPADPAKAAAEALKGDSDKAALDAQAAITAASNSSRDALNGLTDAAKAAAAALNPKGAAGAAGEAGGPLTVSSAGEEAAEDLGAILDTAPADDAKAALYGTSDAATRTGVTLGSLDGAARTAAAALAAVASGGSGKEKLTNLAINAAISYFSGGASGGGGGSGYPDDLPTRGGRASGGTVQRGAMYEVNEQGPEVLSIGGKNYLMMGAQDGQVTANSGAGNQPTAPSAATVNNYMNVSVAPPAGSSRETALQWGAAAGRQIQYATRRNT